MSSIIRRSLSSDRNELSELLRQGRLHLVYMPTMIFLGFGLISLFFGLFLESIILMVTGIITAIILSQLYWGRMSVKWRLKAYQFNYCFTLYKEALREQLIYPENHFMNMFLIGSRNRLKTIKSVDAYLVRNKKLPRIEFLNNFNSPDSEFRVAV